MTAVVPTTLPSELFSSDDMMVTMIRDNVVAANSRLVELGGVFEKVREADSRAEAALEDSSSPAAEAYRDAKESADAVVDKLNDELAAKIKALKEEYSPRIKSVKEEVASFRDNAIKTELGDILGGVSIPDLTKEYTDTYDAVKRLASALSTAVPQMSDWVKTLPSPVKQAKGNSAANRGPRGWTPRFVSITVTDSEGVETTVDPTTLGAAAKAIGIKGAGGRNVLSDRLLGAIGAPSNLSSDPENPSIFTVTKDNSEWTVKVVERAAKSEEDSDESAE